MRHQFTLILSALFLLSTAPAFANGTVHYGRRRVALANSFQQPMQCVLDKLSQQGYGPRSVGCFGYRPHNASAHPTGHACDVDQTGRDITRLNHFLSRRGQIQVASSCRAVSGCKWRHPDCGHFEARSAPYSRAGTRPGGRRHYYRGYSHHPVRRRHHRYYRRYR